jgi:ABC-type Fe3+/spermidine/putrescine transport system ATPase subunit
MNNQLKIENIHKEYEGHPLLNGISFAVNTGEVLCLLGQSGSGKSTLLRIIAGIESADSGRVTWNGEEINNVPVHLRRFGLMFQDYDLFPHLNVRDNIAFGLRMQGIPAEVITEKVNNALAKVNLTGFEERSVTDLSGGEQQRVALARALAPEPRLLMLDEPLAALDRTLRAQLQEELRQLLHQTNIPAIYVTHDQDEALALGDRLALLHEGILVQIGSPEEVCRRPRNPWVARFLGMENILPGKVASLDPFTVETGFGRLETTPCQESVKPGDSVEIVMLSMDVECSSTKAVKNRIPVTVIDSNFRGDHYRVTVQGESGQRLIINLKDKTTRGELIPIQLSPENLLCMK